MAKRQADAAGMGAAPTLSQITAAAGQHHLTVLGGFHAEGEAGLPQGTLSLLLLSPAEPGFWGHLTAAPEWQDAAPDPIDRWSARVIGQIAAQFGGAALFPFGGTPYHPFFTWALRTGQVWQSPVQLLVHGKQGLYVSFRGALALPYHLTLPPPAIRPCDTCTAPCLTACPTAALTQNGYDVPRCHSYLDGAEGQSCMKLGCAVRRACPAALGYARMPEHSAYHMGQFHR